MRPEIRPSYRNRRGKRGTARHGACIRSHPGDVLGGERYWRRSCESRTRKQFVSNCGSRGRFGALHRSRTVPCATRIQFWGLGS